MKSQLKYAVLVLITGLFAACASAPNLPPPPQLDATQTTRTVTGGQVAGFVDARTGAHVWRSIPFAAPPVGDLRWRAPRPVSFGHRSRPLVPSDQKQFR